MYPLHTVPRSFPYRRRSPLTDAIVAVLVQLQPGQYIAFSDLSEMFSRRFTAGFHFWRSARFIAERDYGVCLKLVPDKGWPDGAVCVSKPPNRPPSKHFTAVFPKIKETERDEIMRITSRPPGRTGPNIFATITKPKTSEESSLLASIPGSRLVELHPSALRGIVNPDGTTAFLFENPSQKRFWIDNRSKIWRAISKVTRIPLAG